MTTQLEHRPASGGAPRVVVVGAGFGGLAAARQLARAGAETTLIDRNVYSTFQPLLYEVATAGLTSSDVAFPARSVTRRYRSAFRHGELIERVGHAPLPGWAREIDCSNWAQVLLKFIVSHPAVTCAIPATSRVDHVRQNLGAALGRLPDEGLRRRIVTAVESL